MFSTPWHVVTFHPHAPFQIWFGFFESSIHSEKRGFPGVVGTCVLCWWWYVVQVRVCHPYGSGCEVVKMSVSIFWDVIQLSRNWSVTSRQSVRHVCLQRLQVKVASICPLWSTCCLWMTDHGGSAAPIYIWPYSVSDIIHAVDWAFGSVCDSDVITGPRHLIHIARMWAEDLSVWCDGLPLLPVSRPPFLPPPTSPNPKLRQMDPLEMDADMHSLGSTTWLLDQRDSNRRPVSTKYETTIFWGRNPDSHSSAPHPRTCPSTPVHVQFLKWPLTHTHTVHASPVPSHCDGKASLRTANSCTPSSDLPGDPHQPLYPPWLTVQQLSRASPNTLGQPLSPFAAAADGALEQVILDWRHFTVALLSQPICLFLLILFLTTCICLQIPVQSQRLHLYFIPYLFSGYFS